MAQSFDGMKALDVVCSTMKACGMPLTEDQRSVLAGSLSIILEQAVEHGRQEEKKRVRSIP